MLNTQRIRIRNAGILILLSSLLSIPAWTQVSPNAPPQATPSGTVKPDSPDAAAVDETFDAGAIAKGKKIDHAFIIRNNGKAVLEILSAKPGCGCTVVSYDHTVPPGKDGRVFAAVDTAHFKGPITKTVTVTTNDPLKNTFTLTLKADVISYVEVAPETAAIRIFEGETGNQTLEMRPAEGKTFTVLKVEVDNPRLRVTLAPPAGTAPVKEKSYRLTIETPSDMAPSQYAGMIKLTTDLAEQPEVDVSYNLNIQKLVTVSPPSVFMNISLRPYKIQTAAAMDALAEAAPSSPPAGTLESGRDYPVADAKNGFLQVRFPDSRLGWVEQAKVKPFFAGTQHAIWVSKHLSAPPPSPQAAASKDPSAAPAPPPASGNAPDFKVTGAVSDLPFLRLAVEAKQAGAYLVNILYEGPMEEKNHQGTITLKTNDVKNAEIQVPIQITLGIQAPQDRPEPGATMPTLKPVQKPAGARPAFKP